MKPLTIVLCVLVILSFVFSLSAFLIVTQNGVFTPNSPNTPSDIESTVPTYTAPSTTSWTQPTATPAKTALTIKYTEALREEKGGTTKVTLTIDVTHNNGDSITIKYSDFYLQLAVGRMTVLMPGGTAEHKKSGSFNIGPTHRTQTFQLNFEFNTTDFNGMDTGGVYYQLQYNGSATIQWTNHGFD